MSNNRIVFEGLDALRAALRALPEELTEEAGAILDNRAELARSEIVQRYPRRSGKLRESVQIATVAAGRYGAAVVVKNTARHALLFERGTQARHTAIGANRGAMPPGNVFIPATIRHRRAMYGEQKDMLQRHGLQVSGDA